MRFWKIYNRVYEYKLSPSAFFLYNYISNRFYFKNTLRIKLCTISSQTGLSVGTVRSATSELINKGLLFVRHRYRSGIMTTNEYTYTPMSGKFAMIDSKIFSSNHIDKTSVYLYCAVKRYESVYGHRAFPSYKQLCQLTGLSRATVINKVKLLADCVLIIKQHYIKRSGAHGHNNYSSLTMQLRLYFLISVLIHSKKASSHMRACNPIIRTSYPTFSQDKGGLNFDKHIKDILKYVIKLKTKLYTGFYNFITVILSKLRI